MCLCAQIISGTLLVRSKTYPAISEVVSRCILLVFRVVKSFQAHSLPSAVHYHVQFRLPFCNVLLFWAVLTPLKHSTSHSAMFVYIRVPPNNPIDAGAPRLGPRLSLLSKVGYMLPYFVSFWLNGWILFSAWDRKGSYCELWCGRWRVSGHKK